MRGNVFDLPTVLTILDVGMAAQPLLNEALDEDKLENGRIYNFPIRSILADREIDSSDLHLCGHRRHFQGVLRKPDDRLSRNGKFP